MFDRRSFWIDPRDSGQPKPIIDMCVPEFYLDKDNVTELVTMTLMRYTTPDESILEIGSGTGRNLAALHRLGYIDLRGIEISPRTIEVGHEKFPEYGTKTIPVTCAAVEDVIQGIDPVDVIFTQGCLMHLSPDIEWVFEAIAETARRLIMTIENEESGSERAWVRNYADVFGAHGWKCIYSHTCEDWPPLPEATMLRVYVRA